MPRWEQVPPVDESGRSFALVSVGAPARAVAESWSRAIRAIGAPSWEQHGERVDGRMLEGLGAQLESATVGWRLMLSGPELDVLRLRAAALAAGALDAEVRVHRTSAAARRVYCVHCRAVSEREVAIAGELACPGCGRVLHVYHHVSRRLAAYMGFAADAEEPR